MSMKVALFGTFEPLSDAGVSVQIRTDSTLIHLGVHAMTKPHRYRVAADRIADGEALVLSTLAASRAAIF